MYLYYNSPRFDFGLKVETNSLKFYKAKVEDIEKALSCPPTRHLWLKLNPKVGKFQTFTF
jgi:hypothetical protein